MFSTARSHTLELLKCSRLLTIEVTALKIANCRQYQMDIRYYHRPWATIILLCREAQLYIIHWGWCHLIYSCKPAELLFHKIEQKTD